MTATTPITRETVRTWVKEALMDAGGTVTEAVLWESILVRIKSVREAHFCRYMIAQLRGDLFDMAGARTYVLRA